jgi:hypothetical protein
MLEKHKSNVFFFIDESMRVNLGVRADMESMGYI